MIAVITGTMPCNAVHYRLMVSNSYHLVKVYRLRSSMTTISLAKRAKLTPRIIHMIEKDPDYNPTRRTMIQLSDALGVPPSVLFFPEEELDKRQMISTLVLFCMENLNIDEADVLRTLQNMSLNTHPVLSPSDTHTPHLPAAS